MSTDDLNPPPGPQPGPGAASPAGDVPPTGGATPPPRRSGDGFFDSLRRPGVSRSDDRWVGGVAGGVAQRFGLDPLLVRGLLILSFFLTGAGIVVYAIAWALLPEQRDGRIHLQQAVRGDFDVALLGAVVAFVVGAAWKDGLGWWGFGIEWIGAVFWVAVWVAIIWLVVKLIRDRRTRTGPADGPAPQAPPTPPSASAGTWASTPSDTGDHRVDTHFAPAPPAPYLAAAPAAQPAPYPAASYPAAPRPIPVATPRPPRPPRPARRGPGAGMVGVVLGLVLLGGAVLLVLDRTGDLGVPVWPTWLGASIVVLGLGIVVAGLRGRRGGTLSGLAVLALVAGLVTWPFADGGNAWDIWDDRPDDLPASAVISDGTLVPQSIDEAENGVTVRFGSADVDLTELDLSDVTPGDPIVVPISMTAGSTVVRIPADEAVEAEVEVIAGNVTWLEDGESRSVNTYTNGPARFTSQEVGEAGGARLLLDVDVRAGDMRIEESR